MTSFLISRVSIKMPRRCNDAANLRFEVEIKPANNANRRAFTSFPSESGSKFNRSAGKRGSAYAQEKK
jgi:hypothetical protein